MFEYARKERKLSAIKKPANWIPLSWDLLCTDVWRHHHCVGTNLKKTIQFTETTVFRWYPNIISFSSNFYFYTHESEPPDVHSCTAKWVKSRGRWQIRHVCLNVPIKELPREEIRRPYTNLSSTQLHLIVSWNSGKEKNLGLSSSTWSLIKWI